MSHPQRPPHTPVQAAPANQCLTGCFYQVIQGSGLPGSNVLKLLPILKPKANHLLTAPPPVTPSAATLNVPPAVISSPPPPVSIISKPSPVSVPLVQTPALGNYIITTQNHLPSALHAENPFQEATLFLDNSQLSLPANSVPGNPTIFMMNTKTSSNVKPMPMLPSGHSLQIPAHAEVISLPVSSLPVSIQQKILPQARGTDLGKVPSVIYVSPVNTIKSNNNQSALQCPSPTTPTITPVTSPQQKPNPTGSEALKGPMKWVVQESQESAACLVPVKSSNDTASKILQMMSKTKMEEVNLTSADHSKVVQIKDNALVMCNNKIFFLTKKGTELIDAGSKDLEPSEFSSAEKTAAKVEPIKDLSNKVVQVVLSKNKAPPLPVAQQTVQSNVVSTAKPKRKSFTPRPARSDPSVIYIPDDEEEGCSNVSVKPRDTLPSLSNLSSTSGVKTAPQVVMKKEQPLLKSQDRDNKTPIKAPEETGKDDTSWRKTFGLVKREKIILKRIPVIPEPVTSQSDPGSPVRNYVTGEEEEEETHQLKRKSSCKQTVKASKRQKNAEDEDLNPPPADSPLPVSRSDPVSGGRSPSLETTERSSSTWSPSYQEDEVSYSVDAVDFQGTRDVAGHFSDVTLPSPRFHIDSMYPDETTKDEKIQRLKEVLKEREKALEALRRQKKA
ncbi:hypothetical protein GDO81_007904 [Engystomops pustulosus]|uniref:Ligand dependent nuclear receptor interacting factor 1 n=1 Tax=Engystomops pustulosus TaxID=76066 RepID=A0AAV7CAS8_ENGPU|nr:hypothetical protein GDO81_007904 [Engystomops pustulosus]